MEAALYDPSKPITWAVYYPQIYSGPRLVFLECTPEQLRHAIWDPNVQQIRFLDAFFYPMLRQINPKRIGSFGPWQHVFFRPTRESFVFAAERRLVPEACTF